jgi:hypothetical protein
LAPDRSTFDEVTEKSSKSVIPDTLIQIHKRMGMRAVTGVPTEQKQGERFDEEIMESCHLIEAMVSGPPAIETAALNDNLRSML